MNAVTPSIASLDHGDADQVGAKAANLGSLLDAGFNVPPGFVIPAAVWRSFAKEPSIQQLINALDQNGITADQLTRLRERIVSLPLMQSSASAILAAEQALAESLGGAPMYAVRSSALREDGASSSFAGQHETYYYVTSSNLLTMVQHCWASLFMEHAATYRQRQGQTQSDAAMAVIVQYMVEAEIAGVTFSRNPIHPERPETVTEACWGMGAALVDGRVTPDRFIVSRTGTPEISRSIKTRRLWLPPHRQQ